MPRRRSSRSDGKLTVYDKTQGVQNVQKYLCSVFGLKPEDVRVMSPFMGGGFGSGLRPQFQVVLAVLAARALRAPGARRADAAADVWAGLSAGHDPAHRARRKGRRNARRDHARRDHRDVAIRGLPPAGDRLVGPALQERQRASTRTGSPGSISPTSCDMRAPSAATGVYALECAMDELAVALELDPLELRLRCYSERDQHEDRPYSSKALRECYRQGAEAFGWDKRNPEPRSMRDGSELVGWGMATGVWEALQVPITVRIVLERQWPCRGGVRDLRHRHRHLHHHGAGRGRYARPADREHQRQAGRFEPAAIAGRRRIVDRRLGRRTAS